MGNKVLSLRNNIPGEHISVYQRHHCQLVPWRYTNTPGVDKLYRVKKKLKLRNVL